MKRVVEQPGDSFYDKLGTQRRPSVYKSERNPEPDYGIGDISVPGAAAVTGEARRWAGSDGFYWGAKETHDKLPAGMYSCVVMPNIGNAVKRSEVHTDSLTILPDSQCGEVIDEFKRFWRLASNFKERGFLHKRGFLIWGPPGSGKTSLIQLMTQEIINTLGGIVLQIDHPAIAATCLDMLRKIEPERPLIGVIEDLDALVEKFGEGEFLNLLDGECQIDNVIYCATTNYPERLDPRFVDRPSRFDTITFVGMPSAAARRSYFVWKEPSLQGQELDKWVGLSEGFSIAHLREMIIANRCFEQKIEDVAHRLNRMHTRHPKSSDLTNRVGFSS